MNRTHGLMLLACFTVLAPAPHGAQCETAKLLPSDPAANDRFGDALSTDGASILVGAHDKLTGFVEKGSAYVFAEQAGAWVEIQKLVASDPAVDDEFGHDVAVLGTAAFISNPKDDFGTDSDRGSAYVFRRDAGVWSQVQKLAASDGQEGDLFGQSLAADGAHLVVGALGAPLGDFTGRAYFFELSGLTWVEQQIVLASDWAPGDRFGWDVALEGEWAFVSATHTGDLGEGTGSVYVFQLEAGVWVEKQKLLPSDGGVGFAFGSAIDVDGDVLVASAPGIANVIYVFRNQAGVWVEEAKLTGADAGVPGLGAPVAISGTRIAATASYAGTNLALVFELQGGVWKLTGKTGATDTLPADQFGEAVALSGDLLAVGGFFKEEQGLVRAGAAYAFDAGALFTCLTGDRFSDEVPFVGQDLVFTAGPDLAGDLYLLVGSLSGTLPGTPFGAFTIPLNLDAYGFYTVAHPNQDPLFQSLGFLDAFGSAPAMDFAPSIDVTSLAGLTVNHACLVFQGATLVAVSNPIGLSILP